MWWCLVCLTFVFFLVMSTSKFAGITAIICTVVILPKKMPRWDDFPSGQMPSPKWQSPGVTLRIYLKLSKWSCLILMEQSILNHRGDRYSVKCNSNYFFPSWYWATFSFCPLQLHWLGFLGSTQRLDPSRSFLTHVLLLISYWFPRRFPAALISKCISIHSESHQGTFLPY